MILSAVGACYEVVLENIAFGSGMFRLVYWTATLKTHIARGYCNRRRDGTTARRAFVCTFV